MKKKVFTVCNTMLSLALTALGFSSCGNGGNSPVEYGVPTVRFHATGKVTDEAGNPIPGIKVTLINKQGLRYHQMEGLNDSTTTDAQGKFRTQAIHSVFVDLKEVCFEDIDGPANGGEFEAATLSAEKMTSKQILPGKGHWDNGIQELSGNITLKKKK